MPGSDINPEQSADVFWLPRGGQPPKGLIGSGEQRQRITEFSPMGQRAEYTSRLTALALRIGVLKPLGQKQPVQQIGDKQKR